MNQIDIIERLKIKLKYGIQDRDKKRILTFLHCIHVLL